MDFPREILQSAKIDRSSPRMGYHQDIKGTKPLGSPSLGDSYAADALLSV